VTARSDRPLIGVALKWVDLRPEVDPLTGQVTDDGHSSGCSPADRAALEWALRLAEAWQGEVLVATVGPAGADALLRDALATGADRAVRVEPESPDREPMPASDEVALLLAEVFAGADLICCGDHSLDRGSGSVPAFLAARLGAAQALGLVHLDIGSPGSPGSSGSPRALTATRRLDHGRREVLTVTAPAVVSIEGASAELRRAGLAAVLAGRDRPIEVRTAPPGRPRRVRVVRRFPYRPRAHTIATPSPDLDVRDRILALTGALVDRTPPRTVHVGTAEAADLVIEQLRAWGHLE
jgi:electron transfer flavoprotein beta subunit